VIVGLTSGGALASPGGSDLGALQAVATSARQLARMQHRTPIPSVGG
jgi:hypothetical protein